MMQHSKNPDSIKLSSIYLSFFYPFWAS